MRIAAWHGNGRDQRVLSIATVATGTAVANVLRRRDLTRLQNAVAGDATVGTVVDTSVDFRSAVSTMQIANRQHCRANERAISIATAAAVAPVANIFRHGYFRWIEHAVAVAVDTGFDRHATVGTCRRRRISDQRQGFIRRVATIAARSK